MRKTKAPDRYERATETERQRDRERDYHLMGTEGRGSQKEPERSSWIGRGDAKREKPRKGKALKT